MILKSIIYKLDKDFSIASKKIYKAVVFRYKPFPNILKLRDNRWNYSTICEMYFLSTTFGRVFWLPHCSSYVFQIN